MQVVINWILAHSVILASLGVAVLDLLFALSPNLEANGILHAIYLQLKKLLPGSA